MNAQQFKLMLKFAPGNGIYFRDHAEGRIKVHDHTGQWIATLIPGHLLGQEHEVVVLSMDHPTTEYEWRCYSWGEVAGLISTLQQEGWEAADAVYYGDAESTLDLNF